MNFKIFTAAILLALTAFAAAGAAPPTPVSPPISPLTPITSEPLREIWEAPLVTDANGEVRQQGLVGLIVTADFNTGALRKLNARVELIRDRAAPAPLRKMEEQ
jgi:hypothetical protein